MTAVRDSLNSCVLKRKELLEDIKAMFYKI